MPEWMQLAHSYWLTRRGLPLWVGQIRIVGLYLPFAPDSLGLSFFLDEMRREQTHMPGDGAIITPATIRFFRDLKRDNRKEWMDANRDRYRSEVVEPFRKLLMALAPYVLKLDPGIDTAGRTGVNFSRINRDIRFARDKTPYRPQMYLTFPDPGAGENARTQLYIGISAEAVTAGFRAYAMGPARNSPFRQMVLPRVAANPNWVARQKSRLGRRYQSYWYSTEKGEWTKHEGWPLGPEEWKKLQGWVVRRKFPQSAATLPRFVTDIDHLFRDVYPLFTFVSSPRWKA
jgi:uncharacterized protein (TIGR02453 family)